MVARPYRYWLRSQSGGVTHNGFLPTNVEGIHANADFNTRSYDDLLLRTLVDVQFSMAVHAQTPSVPELWFADAYATVGAFWSQSASDPWADPTSDDPRLILTDQLHGDLWHSFSSNGLHIARWQNQYPLNSEAKRAGNEDANDYPGVGVTVQVFNDSGVGFQVFGYRVDWCARVYLRTLWASKNAT